MGILDETFGKDDDKEKQKADFSDVRSGSSTSAPVPQEAPGAASGSRTYTVQAGDSLSKIAKREYGDASQWKKIHEANRDIIKNPDLIHPGQTLKLP